MCFAAIPNQGGKVWPVESSPSFVVLIIERISEIHIYVKAYSQNCARDGANGVFCATIIGDIS